MSAVRRARQRRSSKVRRLISMMERASRCNWQDSCRQGSLIILPQKGDLLATGDLHGNSRNFDRIVALADLENHPDRHLLLQEVIHQVENLGRSRDMSFLVLEKVANLKTQFPDRVHVMMGNHELSEVQGRTLFKQGRKLNQLFDRGIASHYGAEGAQVKKAYRKFFRSMPLALETPKQIFFCHSIPEMPYTERYDREFFLKDYRRQMVRKGSKLVEELVWGRDFSQETAGVFADRIGARLVVVGHEPCDEGYLVPNNRTLILDSKDGAGCFLLLKLNRAYTHRGLLRKISRLQK
ncbi:MAG: metallophosphoesterase [Planctomycetota bacterium]|jgi:hypothetical protein|nr:metallophosphoesterase [Planctomycetota bacterium]